MHYSLPGRTIAKKTKHHIIGASILLGKCKPGACPGRPTRTRAAASIDETDRCRYYVGENRACGVR